MDTKIKKDDNTVEITKEPEKLTISRGEIEQNLTYFKSQVEEFQSMLNLLAKD